MGPKLSNATTTLLRALLCGSLALSAAAQAQSAPQGWYKNLTITYVYAGQPGTGSRVAIGVSPAVQSGTCPPTNEFTLLATSTYGTTNFFSQMFDLAMTAYKSGLTVSVYANGSCGVNGLLATDLILGTYPNLPTLN